MVRLQVSWKAELENVASVAIPEPAAEFEWQFRVLCTSCHEAHDKVVTFSAADEVAIPGSRGEANFVWKCSFCGRSGSANIEAATVKAYSGEQNGQLQPVVVVECRGMEIVEWLPTGPFKVTAESGAPFSDVELDDGEWADFDDSGGVSVSILNVSSSVSKV